MAYFAKNLSEQDEDATTELLPAVLDERNPQIAFPDDEDRPPTRADLAYGYSQRYLPTQHAGYLAQVIGPDQISRLMGPAPLPTPRALVKVNNFFGHLYQSRLLPGAGVLTMAGLSVWAHSEPYHPLIGGIVIAVGGLLIRSGVKAHKIHGTDADPAFTRGAVGAGIGAAFIGTGVTAGMSAWLALALGGATVVGYIADAAVRHFKLEGQRRFAVGITAAGNTGPALSLPPPPPPWGGPVSDEEYRLRQAFAKLRAAEVIITPVRRVNEGTWSVYADLVATGTTAEEIAKQIGKLTEWAGARRIEALPVAAQPSQLKLIVYDGDDPLEETVPWDGSTVDSILDPVPLGVFEDGSEVSISLAWKHTLIAGTTDMGKSGVLNLVLCETMPCQDLVRILIDCKEGAPEFRAYKDVAFAVATTPEEGMCVLAGLEAVYRYRGQVLVDNDVPPSVDDDGETVQKWEARFGPFILASIDELSELTDKVPGAAKRVQQLRAVQRFIGEFSMDATQVPNKDVFGGTTVARMNYLNRICLALAEMGATNIVLGQGMHGRNWRPDLLEKPGQMFVYSPTNKRPRKARAFRVDPKDVARMVASWTGRVPVLDQGSADAFWEAYHAEAAAQRDGDGGGSPRGGKRTEPQDEPPVYGRPKLVVGYPGGEEIGEKDVQLWQLLGEFGRDGATAKTLAARAEVLGHKYVSPPWVRGRLEFWKESRYVGFEQEGREMRYWRKDLRSEVRDADGAAS
jgi:hypothetical protein